MGYIEKLQKNSIPALVVEMMQASNRLHILHLTVVGRGSFAAHKALQEIYEALVGHADSIAEGYQGATMQIASYPEPSGPGKIGSIEEAISYLKSLHDKITTVQKGVEFSEIVNDLDTAKSSINSAIYKLKFLS